MADVHSTTELDGWKVSWFLDRFDSVYVTSATTPGGSEAALPEMPSGNVPLSLARKYLPTAVVDQIQATKFDDCPRMQQFLKNCQSARESWHEYWVRHPRK